MLHWWGLTRNQSLGIVCVHVVATSVLLMYIRRRQRELAEHNGKKNLNGLESKGSGGCTSLFHPSQCGQSLAWDPGLLGPWSLIQRPKVKAHSNCTSHKQTKANLKDRSENTLQDSKQQARWERWGGIQLLLGAPLHMVKEKKEFGWLLGFNLCDYLF